MIGACMTKLLDRSHDFDHVSSRHPDNEELRCRFEKTCLLSSEKPTRETMTTRTGQESACQSTFRRSFRSPCVLFSLRPRRHVKSRREVPNMQYNMCFLSFRCSPTLYCTFDRDRSPHFPREMIIFILLVFTECIQASGVRGLLRSLPTWTQDSAWHHPENGTPVRQTATEYREKGPSQPPLWSGASLTRDARGSYESLPTGHLLEDLG